MKTIVRLTQTELLDIVARHLGGKVDQIIIAKSGKGAPLANRLTDSMTKQLNLSHLSTEAFLPNLKIAGIKALRQFAYDNRTSQGVVEIGLADAKWAIEHWETWYAFVEKHGRFPKMSSDWGSGETTLT